jgi:amino acid permease
MLFLEVSPLGICTGIILIILTKVRNSDKEVSVCVFISISHLAFVKFSLMLLSDQEILSTVI